MCFSKAIGLEDSAEYNLHRLEILSMSEPKLYMSKMVWDPADPDGRRGWVWLRNSVHLQEIAGSNKSSSKGEEKRGWSLVRRPDSPPDIIITQPEYGEEEILIDKPLKPVLGLEKGVENEQYSGYVADCETSELGPFEMLRNEPDVGVSSKIRGANKPPRNLLPYSGAREAIDKIISAGMDSWEFKWVTKGDTPKVPQMKEPAANPKSPEIAAERDLCFKKPQNIRSLSERGVTSASPEGRGRRRMRRQRPFVTNPGCG
jgi:hypothetical protein